MNLPPTHPPLTPPKRGTIHRALLPSLEGKVVGSGARFAYSGSWILSPDGGEGNAGVLRRTEAVEVFFKVGVAVAVAVSVAVGGIV